VICSPSVHVPESPCWCSQAGCSEGRSHLGLGMQPEHWKKLRVLMGPDPGCSIRASVCNHETTAGFKVCTLCRSCCVVRIRMNNGGLFCVVSIAGRLRPLLEAEQRYGAKQQKFQSAFHANQMSSDLILVLQCQPTSVQNFWGSLRRLKAEEEGYTLYSC
jgi:hypothetical protein